METTKRIWILGAADPEMEAIEKLLRECGESVLYAANASGRRVDPSTAYHCESFLDGGIRVGRIDGQAMRVFAVECDGAAIRHCMRCGGNNCLDVDGPCGDAHEFAEVTILDHHRAGDQGYGRPPGRFFESSSLGQAIVEMAVCGVLPAAWYAFDAPLDVDPGTLVDRSDLLVVAEIERYGQSVHAELRIPHALVLCAAADHCLGAAYHGECPGVDPDELMRWRAESRARFQGRPVADVLADIERAADVLRERLNCDVIWLDRGACPDPQCDCQGGPTVVDMRGFEPPIPELPEAATRLGISYISGPLVGPDGRRKYTVSGSAEQVRAFLDIWAPSHGLVDTYGDPARGFAGAYER